MHYDYAMMAIVHQNYMIDSKIVFTLDWPLKLVHYDHSSKKISLHLVHFFFRMRSL